MRNCLLFTDSFPFGKKESFLESEIIFLSKSFDNVYIVSMSGAGMAREMPKNVFWHSLNIEHNVDIKFKKAVLGLFFKRLAFNEKDFKKKTACFYFRGTVNLAYIRTKKFLRQENIDLSECVLYSYWLGPMAMVCLLLKQDFKLASPTVSRCHGVDLYSYRQPSGINPFQERLIDGLDYIIPISHDGFTYLKNKYPLFADKIKVMHLGTVCEANQSTFFHNSNENVFVTCSNIIELKRLDLFAEAFALFLKDKPGAVWHCFGDGPKMKYVTSLCQRFGIDRNVVFHGRVSNSELLDFYAHLRGAIFVNCSKFEGIPVSIMEAMSFGMPCIATDVGGTKELVNNDNGILLPADLSSADLSSAMIHMTSQPAEFLTSKSQNARATWERKFNASKNYLEWADFLSSL